jgi:hypothetical protein
MALQDTKFKGKNKLKIGHTLIEVSTAHILASLHAKAGSEFWQTASLVAALQEIQDCEESTS